MEYCFKKLLQDNPLYNFHIYMHIVTGLEEAIWHWSVFIQAPQHTEYEVCNKLIAAWIKIFQPILIQFIQYKNMKCTVHKSCQMHMLYMCNCYMAI